jgi:hypothetical protein
MRRRQADANDVMTAKLLFNLTAGMLSVFNLTAGMLSE